MQAGTCSGLKSTVEIRAIGVRRAPADVAGPIGVNTKPRSCGLFPEKRLRRHRLTRKRLSNLRFEQAGELLCRYWRADIKSLPLLATMRSQEIDISGRLNTLDNDAQSKASAHADDCIQDGWIASDVGNLPKKRFIYLEGIEREPLKVARAGVSGAEVIDGHSDTSVSDGLEKRPRRFEALQKNALRQFKFKKFRIQTSFVEHDQQAGEKVGVPELDCRDVDGQCR